MLWDELLAEYGEDYEACDLPAVELAEACAPPELISATGIALKETVNVELILDSSGSMAGEVAGGIKMDVAKETLTDFANSLPAEFNVALRVYGHTGSNNEADRPESCRGTELLYDFAPLDSEQFASAIDSFQPTGWTPIAGSLDAAQQDFANFDPVTNTNFVYLVSDGIETCDGDPVAAAQTLSESDVQPIVNVIGFGVDAEAQQQLEAVAEAGGGVYYSANDAAELQEIFGGGIDSSYRYCLIEQSNDIMSSTIQRENDVHACIVEKSNRERSNIFAEVDFGSSNYERYEACANEIRSRSRSRFREIRDEANEARRVAVAEARSRYEELREQAAEELERQRGNK